MAEPAQRVKETTSRSGNVLSRTTEVEEPAIDSEHKQNVIERVVWVIAGIVLMLLAFRFLLSLLGANTSNQLANFIYSTSRPFVQPFFNLFSYNDLRYGVSRFEVYTLVAIIFYGMIAWAIAKILTINRD